MAYSKEEIDEIFDEIIEDIQTENISLRKSLAKGKEEAIRRPSSSTFFEWLDKDEDKSKHYARAIKTKQQIKFDEILEIADNDADTYIDENGKTRVDGAAVNKKRLQIEARKWQLSKENPKKYGDKIDVTTKDKPIEPAPIFQIVLSPEKENE
jgi:hypothetical protein